MVDEHEMAVAIAKEIGKQVPVKQVYDDAASPAAKQVGATLEDVIKCVRVVGFPIQWLAVQQDRFREFIERAKDAVPEQNRILPAPQILGPVLEGIRYQVDDTPIQQAFRRLLSRAMDRERVGEAHPAFASIIPRLSPDEAHLLVRVGRDDIITEGEMTHGVVTYVGPVDFEQGIVEYKENLPLYINNLTSLGLLKSWISELAEERKKQLYKPYLHTPEFGNRWISSLCLSKTPFGGAFVRACLQDP